MNREDIIRMAREAGWEMDNSCVLSPQVLWYIYQEQLETFAALVASAEREACAKVCESIDMETFGVLPVRAVMITNHCADAIRARGDKHD